MRATRPAGYFPSVAVEPLVQLRLHCEPWFAALGRSESVSTPDGHNVTTETLWQDIGDAIRRSLDTGETGDPQKHFSPRSLCHKWDAVCKKLEVRGGRRRRPQTVSPH